MGRHFGPLFILLHPVILIRKLSGTLIIFISVVETDRGTTGILQVKAYPLVNISQLGGRNEMPLTCFSKDLSIESLVIVCFYNNHHHHKESISSFRDVSWDLGVNSFIKSAHFLNHKANNEATHKALHQPSNNTASHNC